LKLEKQWIPEQSGFSLYIRPFAIATNHNLGVRAANKSMIGVVLSPVGPYYPTGFKPISLMCSLDEIRCAPGGSGSFKLGGNYGSTIAIS